MTEAPRGLLRSPIARFFWHPALLRLSLFVCLFGALALSL
ncbi:DUF1656 domain-containing protein, partial [Pseudomonas shirazica]